MTLKKAITVIVAVLLLAGVLYFLAVRPENEPAQEIERGGDAGTFAYTDPVYGVSFIFPAEWGEVQPAPGNSLCPEEDTYRTLDTLNIYDRELRFPDKKLPGSQSEIRSGVRIYRFDPNQGNGCYDELLKNLATKKVVGEELSSVRLTRADISGFYGVFNQSASRLDTEGRVQYTLFREEPGSSYVLILQPYLSFIPWSDSPEWQEIEAKYKNDMPSYLATGKTAAPVREFIQDFKTFAKSITIAE